METCTPWAQAAAGDLDARNALLTANLSLVYHVARQIARGPAAEVDFDELVSAGTLGLMGAVESFDADRGLAFSTFAVPRIRGAILDELRRQDHVPRSVRRKTRELAQAREALMRILGRTPQDHEIATHLAVDLETVWRWQADVDSAVHFTLDAPTENSDSTTPALGNYLSSNEEAPDDRLAREEDVLSLRDAIAQLKDQERTVLSLCYFEELSLLEIGDLLGLTQSRISQIRSRALGRLREIMGARC